MIKTSNKNAKQYVQKRKEFTGSNTFGRWVDDAYVVYSWGTHFPMFAYRRGSGWCTQTSKYSASTSRHYSLLNPHPDSMATVASVSELRDFIRGGV